VDKTFRCLIHFVQDPGSGIVSALFF